jgi:hypothetical protein
MASLEDALSREPRSQAKAKSKDGLLVKVHRRFIKDDDGSILEKDARDAKALALTGTQREATLSERSSETLWSRGQMREADEFERGEEIAVRCSVERQEVVLKRCGKDMGTLRDKAYEISPRGRIDFSALQSGQGQLS